MKLQSGFTVCVYAIMRDEAPNVAAWAETTGDADLRFVLDTGSEDGTLDELRLVHGIQAAPAVFSPFRFDDARNCALALAPEADLYLRLDADERLPDDWRQQIDEVYDPNVRRYRYRVHNNGGIWDQITRDDLHVRPGFRWKYPTHEVLVGAGPVLDMPKLVVEHTSPPERRTHHLSNLNVLFQAVQEYPGDHRMTFYLGREQWYQGKWDLCRATLTRFLDLPHGWAPERAEAYRILAAIDYAPERWIWKAIGEAPERREPWVDLAQIYLSQGEAANAAMALFAAEQRHDRSIYTTSPGAWDEPFERLKDSVADALHAGAEFE